MGGLLRYRLPVESRQGTQGEPSIGVDGVGREPGKKKMLGLCFANVGRECGGGSGTERAVYGTAASVESEQERAWCERWVTGGALPSLKKQEWT
jgi:hypothetical protein